MKQHVTFPTHVYGHSLDLVITEVANGVELLSCEPGPFISDHCAIKVVTKVKKENIISKTVVFRNFKDMDNSEFGSDLAKLSIESDSVETYVHQFEDEIGGLPDKHDPIKEKNANL